MVVDGGMCRLLPYDIGIYHYAFIVFIVSCPFFFFSFFLFKYIFHNCGIDKSDKM